MSNCTWRHIRLIGFIRTQTINRSLKVTTDEYYCCVTRVLLEGSKDCSGNRTLNENHATRPNSAGSILS